MSMDDKKMHRRIMKQDPHHEPPSDYFAGDPPPLEDEHESAK